jgi:hypothetical protein
LIIGQLTATFNLVHDINALINFKPHLVILLLFRLLEGLLDLGVELARGHGVLDLEMNKLDVPAFVVDTDLLQWLDVFFLLTFLASGAPLDAWQLAFLGLGGPLQIELWVLLFVLRHLGPLRVGIH